MRSPDAAWIEASRWDALSERDKDRFSPIVPDFVIELRSSSDRLSDLQNKMGQWIGNGVQICLAYRSHRATGHDSGFTATTSQSGSASFAIACGFGCWIPAASCARAKLAEHNAKIIIAAIHPADLPTR